jgi:DNA-binding GntR family transcriptional regulator
MKAAPRKKAVLKAPATTVAGQSFSKPEWLANVLRERIINGHYRPGERLIENELRAEFGFSNGPTREALQLLASEGLLERSPWQGSRVIDLAKEEIVELFQIRLALLECAAEAAATRRSAEVMSEAPALKAELKQMFATTQSGGVPDHTGHLTDWIFRAAGNKKMHALWNKTMLQTRMYVYVSIRRSLKMEAPTYTLIDAIVEGQAERARQAAREMTNLQLQELLAADDK